MNTRNGKIARLPKSIRNVLNQRLSDGEQGKALVAWLNELPAIQSIMASDFEGRPINEQNLTEWKQGGYLDWLRQQEALELASHMHEDVSELTALSAGACAFSDTVSTMLTLGLARLLRDAMSSPIDTAEGRKEFLALARELTRLRRVDQRAALVRIEQDKRAEYLRNCAETRALQQAEAEAASRQPTNQQRLDRLTAGLQALQQLASRHDNASPASDIHHPPSSLQDPAPAIKPNQTESNAETNPSPKTISPPFASPAICVDPCPSSASHASTSFRPPAPHSPINPAQS